LKKTAKKTSTSTSERTPPKNTWVGKDRHKMGPKSQLYEFEYECRECGHRVVVQDYTRPEKRICGRCNRSMPMTKRTV
jgi:transcription elongation factor Elf1